jgi:DNA-binding MarR family transcriptional regulator
MAELPENDSQSLESVAFRSQLPVAILNSTGFLLNRTGRVWRERISAALEPLKLSTQELGLLRIIADKGPLSQQELGKRQLMDRTTVVHVLDELEKRGLVVRVKNEADRRSHLLYLTPRGKKTLARAAKIVDREQELFLSPLSRLERSVLNDYLLKLFSHYVLQEID